MAASAAFRACAARSLPSSPASASTTTSASSRACTRNVSENVLEAIARALQLDESERAHLFDLARPSPARRTPDRPQRSGPLQRVLDTIENAPAFILGRRMDVLAWNRLAAELPANWASLPTADRNIARFVFVNLLGKERFVDWDSIARLVVGALRMEAGRHPDDPKLAALIGELLCQERRVQPPLVESRRTREDIRAETVPPPARRRDRDRLRSAPAGGRPRPDPVHLHGRAGLEVRTGAAAARELDRR